MPTCNISHFVGKVHLHIKDEMAANPFISNGNSFIFFEKLKCDMIIAPHDPTPSRRVCVFPHPIPSRGVCVVPCPIPSRGVCVVPRPIPSRGVCVVPPPHPIKGGLCCPSPHPIKGGLFPTPFKAVASFIQQIV